MLPKVAIFIGIFLLSRLWGNFVINLTILSLPFTILIFVAKYVYYSMIVKIVNTFISYQLHIKHSKRLFI